MKCITVILVLINTTASLDATYSRSIESPSKILNTNSLNENIKKIPPLEFLKKYYIYRKQHQKEFVNLQPSSLPPHLGGRTEITLEHEPLHMTSQDLWIRSKNKRNNFTKFFPRDPMPSSGINFHHKKSLKTDLLQKSELGNSHELGYPKETTYLAPTASTSVRLMRLSAPIKSPDYNPNFEGEESVHLRKSRAIASSDSSLNTCHSWHLHKCGEPVIQKFNVGLDSKTMCKIREEFLDCMVQQRKAGCHSTSDSNYTAEDTKTFRAKIKSNLWAGRGCLF